MKLDERGSATGPTRREFVALGVGALVVATLPRVLRPRRRLIRRTVPVMGTVAEVGVVHDDESHAHAAIDAAMAELRRVERIMTRFTDTSEIGRANLGAASRPVPIGDETELVLREGLAWAEASDGAFDPCLGKAVALWNVGRRRVPPVAGEFERFAGRRLYRQLEVGRFGGEPVLLYHDPDIALDLGGIAKGYGVDRAARALRANGVTDGLVNVGGDLYALGSSEDGDAWTVGIRDPFAPDRLMGAIEASNQAVATSGDYLKYFQHGGRRYHHLLDPGTGEPSVSASHSVTVVAEDCLTADAAGTAVFGLSDSQAAATLERRGRGARIVRRV